MLSDKERIDRLEKEVEILTQLLISHHHGYSIGYGEIEGDRHAVVDHYIENDGYLRRNLAKLDYKIQELRHKE